MLRRWHIVRVAIADIAVLSLSLTIAVVLICSQLRNSSADKLAIAIVLLLYTGRSF